MDPDAPSPQDPYYREVRHYLVGNVPKDVLKYEGLFCEREKNLLSGLFCDQSSEILSDFVNPAPPPGTGYHRYVQFVYEQPRYLDFRFTEFYFTDDDMSILNFNITAFAEFYHLYGPVAANYFKTQYEPSEDYTQCGNYAEGPLMAGCESYGFGCYEANQFFYQCLPKPSCIFREELQAKQPYHPAWYTPTMDGQPKQPPMSPMPADPLENKTEEQQAPEEEETAEETEAEEA